MSKIIRSIVTAIAPMLMLSYDFGKLDRTQSTDNFLKFERLIIVAFTQLALLVFMAFYFASTVEQAACHLSAIATCIFAGYIWGTFRQALREKNDHSRSAVRIILDVIFGPGALVYHALKLESKLMDLFFCTLWLCFTYACIIELNQQWLVWWYTYITTTCILSVIIGIIKGERYGKFSTTLELVSFLIVPIPIIVYQVFRGTFSIGRCGMFGIAQIFIAGCWLMLSAVIMCILIILTDALTIRHLSDFYGVLTILCMCIGTIAAIRKRYKN